MGTFLSIQTRVNRRVIDLPAAVQVEVPSLVNEAIVDIQRDHNFKIMETSVEGPTIVNTNTLFAIPSDFKEFRKQPSSTLSSGTVIKLKLVSSGNDNQADLPPSILSTDTGPPQVIRMGSGSFSISPKADGNSDYSGGEYIITIPYWKYLPALVNDSDTNWFTINAERFIVEWAAAQAFGLDWDEEHMAILLQKAEVERKKIILQDKRFRLSGVTELVPHKDANDSNLRI